MTEKQKEVREILQQIKVCCDVLKAPDISDANRRERAKRLINKSKFVSMLSIEDLDIFKEVD